MSICVSMTGQASLLFQQVLVGPTVSFDSNPSFILYRILCSYLSEWSRGWGLGVRRISNGLLACMAQRNSQSGAGATPHHHQQNVTWTLHGRMTRSKGQCAKRQRPRMRVKRLNQQVYWGRRCVAVNRSKNKTKPKQKHRHKRCLNINISLHFPDLQIKSHFLRAKSMSCRLSKPGLRKLLPCVNTIHRVRASEG